MLINLVRFRRLTLVTRETGQIEKELASGERQRGQNGEQRG